jgi:hypothetical protein
MFQPTATPLQARPRRLAKALAGLMCAGLSSLAAAQSLAPFVPSADGSELRDTRNGLVWQRCSVGQTWRDAQCTGSARTVNHAQALALAAGQAGWRLPSVDELKTLVDTTRTQPAINLLAFPGTPSFGYWTATAVPDEPDYAWVVHFGEGEAQDDTLRSDYFHLRWVR